MTKRLLLVDDEPDNLSLLEGCLGDDYAVTRAHGGREAIELYDRLGTDLVLCDVAMPDVDGFDVLRHVRAHDADRFVPVVLVTAGSEREHRLRAIELGASELLEKPVERAMLLARVRALLARQDAEAALRERNSELLRAQRQQRELTGFLVHDLKNQIGIVTANLAFACEDLGDEHAETIEALADAQGALRRLSSMVSDLSTIARLEDSELRLATARIEAKKIADEVAQAFRRDAELREVRLEVEEMRATAVADLALVRRVVENLVDNALRGTPRGGVVKIRAGDGDVFIRVSNTGAAMSQDAADRVFDKFGREGGPLTTRGNFGLGLYFCRLVMRAHGGEVSLSSSPEWPVTFELRFPSS